MDIICPEVKNSNELIEQPFEKLEKNLDYYANKYRLTIYFFHNKLVKSKKFGPEVFILVKNGRFFAHKNPGKLAKLPAGVSKLDGCKYDFNEMFGVKCGAFCNIHTKWAKFEKKIGKGINIWRKESIGLNKSVITNVRRSKMMPAIHLHCDKRFNIVFLVTCDKLYFRSHRRLIN